MPRKRVTAYPLDTTETFPTPSLFRKVNAVLRTFRDAASSPETDGIEISSDKPYRPLNRDDIPLIVLTHNDIRLIPAFLNHYRSLGVTRFIIVDDASDDGTRDLLSNEPDVDLHISNVRYKDAKRGRLWRMMLVERYGRDRWYLNVDSDEFLVYRDAETHGLKEVINALTARRIRHFVAPMLDMYPSGAVRDAHYTGDGMPWNVASHFDASGYTIRASTVNWRLEGGVRHRVFNSTPQLAKYPLMYWDALTNLNLNIHAPAPYWRNFAPPMGMLLHFKFFSDFHDQFRTVIKNGQHYDGSALYSQIVKQISDPGTLVLEGAISARYSSATDLYDKRFLADWRNTS